MHTVGIGTDPLGRVRDGDPGLANTGRADHGDQARIVPVGQLTQRVEFAFAVDERVGEDRQHRRG